MAEASYRNAKRFEARRYMVRYWRPEILGRLFQRIYREALER